jgi:nicotinamide phosphoribosyltransferase
MIRYPALLQKDMYKAFHVHAYKPGVTHVYSNFTNRSGRLSNVKNNKHVVFVGLQYFMLTFLIDDFNETFFKRDKAEACVEYKRYIEAALGKPIDIKHIEALHDLGYLPLCIKALKEGSLVPYGVPPFVIFNTVAGFGWLTNMIETVLSAETWGISTSATTAFAFRQRFEQSSLAKEVIKFMGHDFSYRGMWGTGAAAMSGFGHLCSFVGSDTIPAAYFAEKFYGAKVGEELVFASVDATEHSVMCSYNSEGELDCLRHLITKITPSGIISIVSDTWDFWKLVSEYLVTLKDEIMARDGTVVIRPDSGDPVDILCGTVEHFFDDLNVAERFFNNYHRKQAHEDCEGSYNVGDETYSNYCKVDDKYYQATTTVEYDRHDKTYYYVDESNTELKEVEVTPEMKGLVECLWDTFGGVVRDDGLRQLDSHIGAIYGDSITLERQDQIINKLEAKGFVPSVVLGIGSFSYQMCSRDTHGSAVKATDIQFGTGNHQPIFKDPKTDQKKKSAKGLLRVDLVNGEYVLTDDVTPEREGGELQVVFLDGQLVNPTTLNDIRARIDSHFA